MSNMIIFRHKYAHNKK